MPNYPVTDILKIYKLKRTGNTEAYDTVPAYENVNATLSPTGTDIQPEYGDVAAFQLFEIFIYDPNVQISNADKLVTDNNIEYIVSGKPYVINNRFMAYTRILGKQVV